MIEEGSDAEFGERVIAGRLAAAQDVFTIVQHVAQRRRHRGVSMHRHDPAIGAGADVLRQAGVVGHHHRFAHRHHLAAGEGDRFDVVGQHEARIQAGDDRADIIQKAGEMEAVLQAGSRQHLPLGRRRRMAGNDDLDALALVRRQQCQGWHQVGPSLVVRRARVAADPELPRILAGVRFGGGKERGVDAVVDGFRLAAAIRGVAQLATHEFAHRDHLVGSSACTPHVLQAAHRFGVVLGQHD